MRYALPLGPLGAVANSLLVRHDLGRIVEHRREATVTSSAEPRFQRAV